jgi:7-cyano-7-deazaguanine synthase in queuosine biosynthesis
MRRKSNEAVCIAYGRITRFGNQRTTVELGGSGWLETDGPLGSHPIGSPAADLLDIATVIYAIERQLPSRGASNPNIRYELTVPVRDPVVWEGQPTELLQELLGFLGNAKWLVKFVRRYSNRADAAASNGDDRSLKRVALLSGGLDSACGAGAGFVSSHDTQLCSFYTRQKEIQREIARTLGYQQPTQWRHKGVAGRGRSFYYRSFLFLTLGAVTAQTWGASEIVQFENGILASAIPPVPSDAMTKHAHPRLHYLLKRLLESILPGKWNIVNPLWLMTKRQAVKALEESVGQRTAAQIISITETCWNLTAPHAFGIRRLRSQVKHVNEQCGVCIPCIIRRTALPKEHVAFDLRLNMVRNHPKLGAYFMEYIELLSAIRSAKNTAEFRFALPSEARELLDDNWIELGLLEKLWRVFADEFFETFF